jgi:hypothetical protein
MFQTKREILFYKIQNSFKSIWSLLQKFTKKTEKKKRKERKKKKMPRGPIPARSRRQPMAHFPPSRIGTRPSPSATDKGAHLSSHPANQTEHDAIPSVITAEIVLIRFKTLPPLPCNPSK